MSDKKQNSNPQTVPVQSSTFSQTINAEIRRAAATGIYDIRGGGAKRKVPHFDDLLFLGASISRYPLEGYREKCETKVTLGTRFAKNPIEIDIPITIAGMSFGSLSGGAKEALGRGASMAGTSTTTGDGGMTAEERGHSSKLVYQYLPSRYGMNPDDLRKADAIEVVVGKAQSPAVAACCWDKKFLTGWRKCVTCQKALTSGLLAVTPTGPAQTTWKLKFLSYAKSLVGGCQSTSKLVERVRILIPHWR